ncbi:periplasmic repressor CpxP [Vibrio ichthyoenteri ATCC 700023]|uniref:Periplasmic repressor CpxP n=1 Tax=Vibrio ichthyoenteri ATCC 700023 TaxID=870968 RepID=F9S8D8_9VIBR|nr:CpxP family protein [Vibrio ichthyoenteri]EGU30050.1 periplasmic repressor CpxP [Vibrio ichthyoenteri ATCC 700023]
MKTVKKFVLAAAIIPLAFASASAMAFGGKGDHKGGQCQGGMDRGMMKKLELTDAQKTQLKEMREANKTEMKAKFAETSDARKAERQAQHEKVQQLVLADNFDQAAANELAKNMVEKQTERKVKMLEKQHQMLSVLTPEQKAKFVELSKERMEKCGEKRKNHH